MRKKYKIGALKLFGEQLRRFREGVGLTQDDFAWLMDTGPAYISKVERGEIGVGLENMERYSDFFGVYFFELANPSHPIPSIAQLPNVSRKRIVMLEKKKQKKHDETALVKAQQRDQGIPGRAKQLHKLINDGFLNKPKTARQLFSKLNPAIPKADYGMYTIELSKITNTLSSGRFLKLLDKLEPAPGTTAVRFVQKDPSVVKYLDGHAGTKDMAADRE